MVAGEETRQRFGHPSVSKQAFQEVRTETGDEGTVQIFRGGRGDERTIDVRLSHFLNVDNRDGREKELGLTIQYLAEENARLAMSNAELTRKLEVPSRRTDDVPGVTNDIEIYGETAEERLRRLEKALEIERREKWRAIEDGERTRVDLVNCERELRLMGEDAKRMKAELSAKRSGGSGDARRAKTGTEEDDEESDEEERQMKRRVEMDAFAADLSAKREIRRRALASKSSEMQKLRDELKMERRLRWSLQRPQTETVDGVPETFEAKEMENLRQEIETLRSSAEKSARESEEYKSLMERLRRDMEEEKKKREAIRREMKSLQRAKEEKERVLAEMEEEKERMWCEYDREKSEVTKRTAALKEVIQISREMLVIRENQVQQLKKKLKEIEESVSESKFPDHGTLKAEYEKQLNNIKALKELYEERVRLMEMERNKLNETITGHSKTMEDQKTEIERLREECGAISGELKNEKFQNDALERDLMLSAARSKDLENELSLINNLFTRMLLGPYNTGSETDLDKLTELLQENHDLITELTLRESSSEIASALPKLLLDLITQVDGPGQDQEPSEMDSVSEKSDSIIAEGAVLPILSYKKAVVFGEPCTSEAQPEVKPEPTFKPSDNMNPAVQEIASNLPKVWRVLTELLSHHTVPDGPPPGDEKQCYKSVETPTGTRNVISVSNTFIRLKDLILEKNALQKELTRLKQLNSHLESRLDDQEKRLSHVQSELHKTWGIVGRMRAQHQQLHNHEKILRYELQEKRVMLTELKQELEYCKDKWERARQKNNESESQWQKLRREFAARKSRAQDTADLNDSGESGFSDEPNESGEDVENFDADRSSTQSPVLDEKPDPSDESREASCGPDGGQPDGEAGEDQDRGASCLPSSPADAEKLRLREERLKRLEDQCRLLVRKVDVTTSKRKYLSDRLEELHEQYGPEGERTNAAADQTPGTSATVEEAPASGDSPEVETGTGSDSATSVEDAHRPTGDSSADQSQPPRSD